MVSGAVLLSRERSGVVGRRTAVEEEKVQRENQKLHEVLQENRATRVRTRYDLKQKRHRLAERLCYEADTCLDDVAGLGTFLQCRTSGPD